MTLYELADLLDLDINIKRHANQDDRFTASFEHTETLKNKQSSILESTYGDGKTPTESIQNYIQKIEGRYLVINAMLDSRREFNVPKNLEF